MATISTPSNRMGQATDRASNQATNTLENVAQGVHQTVDRIAEKAAPIAAQLQSGVDRAAEAVQDGLGQLKTKQQEWTDSARSHVRQRPFVVVAAAVAAGLLISRLISR